MKATKPIEVVIQPRVSSKEQETDGYSLSAQGKLLIDYCGRRGFKIKKTFSISETASKSSQRQTFQKMMNYIEKNNVKILVVEKVDRLVRNFKDTVLIDDWLEGDIERQVHFVKNALVLHQKARSQEKLNWGFQVVIAKNFIDNLKEEVDKGMKEKLAQGWLPGTPPLGYKTVGSQGKKIHEIDEETAPLIRRMFELYLEPEYSLSTVTSAMKRLGLRTRRGRPLMRSHITKLLSHNFYLGKIPWDGQVYPGKHDPLISTDLFDAVQRKMKRKNPPKYSKHRWLFQGLFLCEECGGRITWEKHKGIIYGHCNRYRGCSKKPWAKQEDIENQLLNCFEVLKNPSPALLDWVKGALREQHESEIEVHLLSVDQSQKEHDKIRRKLHLLYEDRLSERITTQEYDHKRLELEEEAETIRNSIKKADANSKDYLEGGLNILELSERAAEIYRTKNLDDRRVLIAEIFSNLTLKGQFIDYEYTKPVSVVARRIEETKELIKTFELTENGFIKDEKGFLSAARPIWLGR
jgi:site-specific DNA recombinase